MEKEQQIEYIASLIMKMCLRTITDEESELLAAWRSESAENEQLFCRFQNDAVLEEHYARFVRTSYPNGWEEVKARIARKNNRKRRIAPAVYRYAAVAVILLGVGSGLLWMSDSGMEKTEWVENFVPEPVQPGSAKATLILGSGQQIALKDGAAEHPVFLAEAGAVVRTSGLVYDTCGAVAPEYHRLVVPRGGEYKLQFSDGSCVWLNSATTLRYPNVFGSAERKVYVEGEAYFQVAKDKDRPFIVETSGVNICVTGTEFNVTAYQDEEKIVTTLVTGGVVIRKGERNVELAPSCQAIFSKQQETFELQQVDTDLYTSWRSGVFEFADMPLKQICAQLGRWYDVEFTFQSPEIGQIRFNGAVRKEKSLEFILNIIESTKAVKYEIEERQVVLKSK